MVLCFCFCFSEMLRISHLVFTPLENWHSSFQHPLTTQNLVGMSGSHDVLLMLDEMFTDPVVCRSYTHTYTCNEFIRKIIMSCTEDKVLLHLFPVFIPPLQRSFLSLRRSNIHVQLGPSNLFSVPWPMV